MHWLWCWLALDFRKLSGWGGFGRPANYDPRVDSVVRMEASRLRARLQEYYAGAGADSELVIELPKGGYAPAFRVAARALPASFRVRWPWAAAAVAIVVAMVVLAGLVWSRSPATTAEPVQSLVVLPFVNLSLTQSSNTSAMG
jgi:adenylate cyclase